MSTLQTEVEKLRAQLAAAETGTEIPAQPPQDEPDPRRRTVVSFWCDEFERVHGFKYVIQTKDAVNLSRLQKLYTPSEKLAWCIRTYLESDDEWTADRGYDVSTFTLKVHGLAFKYVKSVQEPALRREKLELERQLKEFERNPRVVSLVSRLAK